MGRPITPIVRFVATLLLVASVAACSEYLDRRDTILLGAGDAVQTNLATHVIDPWPAAARRVDGDTDGARLQRAQERYRAGQVDSSSGGGASAPVGFAGAGVQTGTPQVAR